MLRDLNTTKLFLLSFLLLVGNHTMARQKPTNEKFVYARATLDEGIRKRDSTQIAEGYYLLGKAYGGEHDYPEAYRLMYQSLKINEKLKNWYSAGKVYLRLTDFELEQKKLNEAKDMLSQAVEIFQKYNIENGIVDAYYLYGLIYMIDFNPKPNYDSAMYYFRKLESLAIHNKSERHIAGAREKIGSIYTKLHDKRALPNLEYAIKIKRKENPDTPFLMRLGELASCYLMFGYLKQANEILKEAHILIDRGLIFDNYGLVYYYGVVVKYYKSIKDWEKAYEAKEKLELYQYQILQEDRTANVSQWRIKLETEKKDLELKLQKTTLDSNEKQISQQKYLLIITGVFLSILVVLLFYLYKNYQKQKQLSQHNAILIQEQNHRVKNNLQIISSLLSLQSNQLEESKAKQAVDESQLRIEAMAVLHRQLYDTQELDKIDMDVFINSLSDIIFESYGIEDIALDYQINVKPLQADKAVFLGLMINEFISNACKHAFANHPAPAFHISLSETKNQIVMQIKDNGLRPINTKKKESFGMKLINMMVDQLDGKLSYEYNRGSVFTLKIA